MPLPVDVKINASLIGQLEAATIATAATAYATNPVAARALLQTAMVALFEPPVSLFLLAAIGTAVAAYCLSQFGADPPATLPKPTSSNPYSVPGGLQEGRGFYTTALGVQIDLVFSAPDCPTSFWFTFHPMQQGVSVRNYITIDWPNGSRFLADFQVEDGTIPKVTQITPCTGPVITPTPEYPPLTEEQEGKIRSVGLVSQQRAIPKKPLPQEDPNQTIPPLIAGVSDDQLECCSEINAKLEELKAEIDKVLKRVKKVSSNIGLPDLDGTNYGNIFGPLNVPTNTIAEALNFVWAQQGAWGDGRTTQLAGTNFSTPDLWSYTRVLDSRIGYLQAVDPDAPCLPVGNAVNVESHICKTRFEGAEPMFSLGYPQTEGPTEALVINYTDKSQYRLRKAGMLHIQNPKPDLTPEQIMTTLGTRTPGQYWCTIRCADNTKIAGWFVTPEAGQLFLTNACSLQASGFRVPLEFTATRKTRGVPGTAGKLLTATSYSHHRLGQNNLYETINGRLP